MKKILIQIESQCKKAFLQKPNEYKNIFKIIHYIFFIIIIIFK
jgi:hypothetical protein